MWEIIAAVVCIVVLAVLLISFRLFRIAIVRPKKHKDSSGNISEMNEDQKRLEQRRKEGVRWFRDMAPEEVSIVSFDGLELYGRLLLQKRATRGTVIMMHGFHSSGEGDFSCQLRHVYELGFNILLPDERSHGKSQGEYICFGALERYDCRDWIFFLNEILGELPIYLYGISMGASTVMLTSALKLPQNVRGVIADCGYTSPWDIFSVIIKRHFHLPPIPFIPIASLISKAVAGFFFGEADCEKALKQTELPVLLIHGASDDFVPPEMTITNWRALDGKRRQLFFVADAGHADAYTTDTYGYDRMFDGFIADCEKRRDN